MGLKRTRKIRKIKVSKKKKKKKQNKKQKPSKKKRNYSKKQRVFLGGLPTVSQGDVPNCMAHATSRCIYRLFKLLVKRGKIEKERLNIVLSGEQRNSYGDYMKIGKISDGMVKVIRAITTLKDDENFTIRDLNNKFDDLKSLFENKPKIKTLSGLLLEDKDFIKLYAAILSLRMGSGYRKKVWNDHKNNMKTRNEVSKLRHILHNLFTNDELLHRHHQSNQDIFKKLYSQESEMNWDIEKNVIEDDKIIDLQNQNLTDFEMKLALYNLIKKKDERSPSIDETKYTEIAEIEEEQRKVYDTLLPILTYDYYIFSNNGIYNNNSKRGNTPYYNQADKKTIVESVIFKKYNNTTDDDNNTTDDDNDATLTTQVEKYIELMNKIPEDICISVKFFSHDNRNPWKWITDYIDYKNMHTQNVESTYTAFYNDKGGCGHQLAITTSDDNPTGIEDTDGEYIVTYKNSHNVKFGREGYDTDILNKNNTANLQILEHDKKNNSSHQKFKAGITSFELKEKVQEPKNP
jgi:hypothetical protein